MTLQGQLQAMCDNLHAVIPYFATTPPGNYRVICNDGVNRISAAIDEPLWIDWIGTTPPARISLDFHERDIGVWSTNPIFRLTGDVIDCGYAADDFYGATWFRMVNIDLRGKGAVPRPLRWAKISHRGSNADSIGLYVPPWYGH